MSAAAPQPASAPALSFTSVARTHVGRVRSSNQDRFVGRDGAALWAVADGMGGHQGGELAAGMLVDALAWLDLAGAGPARLETVCASVDTVNAALVAAAAALPDAGTIGSTLVVLIAHRHHFACLWAGDSRAYLLRDGALARITHDHSLVQSLVDNGALSPAEARGHPRANIITRAVGIDPRIVLDSRHAAVVAGDLFLLCSDGLTAMVSDSEIEAILRENEPEAAADALISRALEAGGKDNVTLVLVSAV